MLLCQNPQVLIIKETVVGFLDTHQLTHFNHNLDAVILAAPVQHEGWQLSHTI